jgi:hypothetical protein
MQKAFQGMASHISTVHIYYKMRAEEESTGSRYDESKIRVWYEMVAGQEVTLKTISFQVGFSVVHVLLTAAHSTESVAENTEKLLLSHQKPIVSSLNIKAAAVLQGIQLADLFPSHAFQAM